MPKKTDPKQLWKTDGFPELFDLAARLIVLEELDKHGDELEREMERFASKEVKKYQRAVIKAYVKTEDERALKLFTKHLMGEHEQKDHGRWAHEGTKYGRDEEGNRIITEEHAYLGSGPGQDVFNFGRLVGLPNKLAGKIAHASDHMHGFLDAKDWGKKVLAAGDFLVGQRGVGPGSKLRLAAKLSGEYGQPTTQALKLAYFKYTGHTVPVDLAKSKQGENRKGTINRVVARLQKDIPTTEAGNLTVRTDSFPPSEGYIINRDGEVVGRAVGKSKDHYTPFDVRQFKDLEGGSFVRRRIWGGPTKEDFHLAMLAGAKDFTVVTRHGTWTVPLTDRARQNRGVHATHVRILDRWDKLYNNSGRNASGTRDALRALKAEFPLHFGDMDLNPIEGKNRENEHDRKHTFKIFNRKDAEDSAKRHGGGEGGKQKATPVQPPDGGGGMLPAGRTVKPSEENRQAREAAERAGAGTSQQAYRQEVDEFAGDILRKRGYDPDDIDPYEADEIVNETFEEFVDFYGPNPEEWPDEAWG